MNIREKKYPAKSPIYDTDMTLLHYLKAGDNRKKNKGCVITRFEAHVI